MLLFPESLGQTPGVVQKTPLCLVALPSVANSVLQRKHLEENVSTGLMPFSENIIMLKNDSNVNGQNHSVESG